MINLEKLKTIFVDHDDFIIKELIFDNMKINLLGFNTLVDFTKSNLYVRQMTESSTSVDELLINISNQLDVDLEQILNAVLEGKLVILLGNGKRNAIVDPFSHNLTRNVDEPRSENPIHSSSDAFVEDININIGLIRKKLSNKQLCHYSYKIGELDKRRLSLLYINGKAPKALIKNVSQQLENIKSDIETVDDLNKYFSQRKLNIVSHLFSTEIPSNAIHFLKKNRIVFILDNYPFAIVYPSLFFDMFNVISDQNYTNILAFVRQFLRIIGALSTLILPALYVSLISVNPEILKLDLALYITANREGIPLSPILETILMVVLIDFIIEAVVRLPKSVGPTITMVGGIILGQGMIEAGLISSLLVIVVTTIVISSSVLVGVENSIYMRMLSYPILVLSSIFGILGLFIGLTFIIVYLSSLTTNGIPYVAFYIEEKGDIK
ncbi:spore germination protein [Paenibacillus melissococcoides]|uniref:Spore germination protein n=1 Tax=Paenibacillus melissococcoides TaxID=2912268 RepID=A0ABM9GBL5_9BACL|nr:MULTISPECIES: spore germination protein [Paenibacillus]MEB9895000.1 spore germination protein [Bacillus cereus]GIO78996.1 spore germination protein [Paenibacillus dendritiformis]CAH8249520.1 spore germination protein [Paenibacillus melissococcoides]CAH8721143.1 spore germination protein [Paenibacillus melissococcoides]